MNIIEIKRQDIKRAAEVLTLSFQDDPIFQYIFRSPEKYHQSAPWMFATWVRWTVLYGKGWITEDGSAIALMRSPGKANMSLWSMINAGMLPTPIKLGFSAFKRFYFEIVAMLDKKHALIMGNEPHLYGWMIGVNPGKQHKGIGLQLMNHCFKLADEKQLPIYLETSVEKNVSLYNYKDFKIKDTGNIAGKFNLYFMVRDPQPLQKKKQTKYQELTLSNY
jgi:ribosomal protein S18 acetylase RimI-like enzyme